MKVHFRNGHLDHIRDSKIEFCIIVILNFSKIQIQSLSNKGFQFRIFSVNSDTYFVQKVDNYYLEILDSTPC